MILEPKSDAEWEAYMLCRYETLRKPWNQPMGSEQIPDDDDAFHAMYVENELLMGVIRMHKIDDETYQIRSMGVREEHRKKGIGKKLIHYMENLAKSKKAKIIFMHARDYAIPFYEKCGYVIVEKSYLLFDEIQHYKMEKEIAY